MKNLVIVKNSIILIIGLFFLTGCSASYKKLSKIDIIEPSNFNEYLLNEYKIQATFEAEEMHDWNSAKLYSEKGLKSLEHNNIYPEEVSYWEIPKNKIRELQLGYDNLMSVYNEAKIIDPLNLAKAISAFDCWAEQEEEGWQTWDIKRCKEKFLNATHNLYEKLSSNKNQTEIQNKKTKNKDEIIDEATIVTKNKNNELLQIIYFDFDEFMLSSVSYKKINLFLNKYKNQINEYIVVGHTDTKGSKNYNITLSIKRAKIVKQILVENGVESSKIKILGKGEEKLAIMTPDDTKQAANRRVEIKKVN